jgi:hypothetical protein
VFTGGWTVVPAEAPAPRYSVTPSREQKKAHVNGTSIAKMQQQERKIEIEKARKKGRSNRRKASSNIPPTPEEAHLFVLRLATFQLGYKIF